jgi:uncharacterized protein
MDRRSFVKNAVTGAGTLAAWRLAGGEAIDRSHSARTTFKDPWLDPTQAGRGSTYRRLKAYIDSIPSIDMHEHLAQFDHLSGYVETAEGHGMNLYGLLNGSYMSRIGTLTPWKAGERFENWWSRAKHDFDDVRAMDFYRYIWLAIRDLYGVDLDHITDAQAADLNRRIGAHYRNQDWLDHVIHKRANIDLMVCDRYWKRFDFHADYSFELLTFNVTTLVWGFHSSEFVLGKGNFEIMSQYDDPYLYARQQGLPMNSLGDYLALLDYMFAEAKKKDAICLKTTLAYMRSLYFAKVAKEKVEPIFGRSRSELTQEEVTAFEDFIMWRLCELSAKYDMPFQIHTGDARIQGSNPMFLVNMIEANPGTKFELFHGGFPWVRETGAIGAKFARNVWIDCVWLPTISYATARSAFGEWLEVMPSSHLTWGGDDSSAEGIYGETELVRHCWAEVLAEKVDREELAEDDARRIAKQIMRDNALELYPRMRSRAERRDPSGAHR